MVIRSKLPSRSIALGVAALMVLFGASPLGPPRAFADPMSDSFASGGKRPAHRPAQKAKKGNGNAAKPARPAHPAKPAARPSRGRKPKIDDDEFAAGADSDVEAPPPRREEPEDRPRSRRAADADEESAAPAESQSSARDESDEEEDRPAPRRPPPRKPVITKVSPPKGAKKKRTNESDFDSANGGADDDANGGEDDDDDDDSDGNAASLPSIAPRAVLLGVGAALMGRSFEFAAPAQLQHESSFPRFGFALELESFPLLLASRGWWQQIGIGASYASEPVGQAAVTNPATGMSLDTPVKQTRWSVDLRVALPLGERLVLTPHVGLLASSFTLSTKMPIMASTCTSTTATACLPDTNVMLLSMGGVLRIAATADLGFSLGGAYLLGLGVTNRPLNEIGYEISTSATGFAGELGASLRLTDWLAVRALLPVTRIGYKFLPTATTPATVNYRSATELVWGFSLGLAIFTN